MKVPPRMPGHPNVYWHGDGNVGDHMAGWLASRISGKPARFTHHTWREPKVFVTGSILSLADETTTVWGAGIPWRHDPIDPRCTILAVRGPITRQRALECGAECPEVYGDPALLLPRLYTPEPLERRSLGIVPHVVDYDTVAQRYGHLSDILRVVDLRHSVESVVNAIASCEIVVSSSLHGLIIAHAYGVPIGWVEFSDKVIGDGTKFADFYASLGHDAPEPLDARAPIPCSQLNACVRYRLPNLDTESLWNACPFLPSASS